MKEDFVTYDIAVKLKEKGVIDYQEKRNNTWRESINVCD